MLAATAPPRALVGQSIDVHGRPATVALPAVPGRNIGVIGADGTDAVRVLAAAALSLDAQHGPDRRAVFVLAPLVAEAYDPADVLAKRLSQHPEIIRLDKFAKLAADWARDVVERLSSGDQPPTYLVLYAADAADALQDRVLTENLRKVLRFGPEVGVHTIGWWRSPARLKSLLSMSASPDDLGSFLALDVQGAELGPLAPPGLLPVWSPRPGRALWFDRARHSRPEVVIVPAVGGKSTDEPTDESAEQDERHGRRPGRGARVQGRHRRAGRRVRRPAGAGPRPGRRAAAPARRARQGGLPRPITTQHWPGSRWPCSGTAWSTPSGRRTG